jgi:hypothetical protein
MEGKLESVILQLSQKRDDMRDDMTGVFTRLRSVETRVAIGLGITLCLTFIIPVIITATAPKILFQQESVVERAR